MISKVSADSAGEVVRLDLTLFNRLSAVEDSVGAAPLKIASDFIKMMSE